MFYQNKVPSTVTYCKLVFILFDLCFDTKQLHPPGRNAARKSETLNDGVLFQGLPWLLGWLET
jgi:hypothetical protein